MIKKCLFPAAGYGTRFLPATKAMPKEMLPVVNKPLIQYGVEEALDAGLKEISIVTGRGKPWKTISTSAMNWKTRSKAPIRKST
jgi:UTP--glucose-1-phosphate uridylyltransferase